MTELERRLQALAADAFPPVPDVSGAVAERIARERAIPAPARSLRRRPLAARRRVLALALALVLLPAGAVAAVPAAREAVLDWLGLASVRVERVPRVPSLPGLERPDLGERVPSVRAASSRAGFAVVVPRALGAPDGVYVAGGVVSLAYEPRRGLPRDAQTGLGLLVTQLRALPRPEYLMKAIGPGTRFQEVRVGGAPGFFLSGDAHALTVEQPGGRFREIPPRLAGNTLAFERGGLAIRLEARFDRRHALALARSVAPT